MTGAMSTLKENRLKDVTTPTVENMLNGKVSGVYYTIALTCRMNKVNLFEYLTDVIITDPPRAGMHNDVIDVILAAEPKRIVYVSCHLRLQSAFRRP